MGISMLPSAPCIQGTTLNATSSREPACRGRWWRSASLLAEERGDVLDGHFGGSWPWGLGPWALGGVGASERRVASGRAGRIIVEC
jgi:hypothetical protein